MIEKALIGEFNKPRTGPLRAITTAVSCAVPRERRARNGQTFR